MAARCIYREDDQKRALEPFVDMFHELARRMSAASNPPGVFLAALPHFLRLATYYEVLLKHHAYDEEAEVRLVSLAQDALPSNAAHDDAAGSVPGSASIGFPPPPKPLKPFVTVQFPYPAHPMPLAHVVAGPKVPFAGTGARVYLRWHGFATTRFSLSETPFR